MAEALGLLGDNGREEVILRGVDRALLTPCPALQCGRSAARHLRTHGKTHEGPGVYTVEDISRKVVLMQLVDDRLRTRVRGRHDRCEHAFDLVQAVLERLDIALWRPSAEARG